MDTCKIISVIENTRVRRGDGTPESPIRIVTEYWLPNGTKIAEVDPAAVVIYPEQFKFVAQQIAQQVTTPANLEGFRELYMKGARP